MEWPVSLVLNHKALAQYQMLFRYSHAKIFSSFVDPDPDWIRMQWGPLDPYTDSQSGSGSRRAKIAHHNRKKLINLIFSSAGCSVLRDEGFHCSLDVLYGGLGIRKLQFSIN